MSIIYEALQKAQRYNRSEDAAPLPESVKPAAAAEKKLRFRNRKEPLLALAIFLIAAVTILLLLNLDRFRPDRPAQPASQNRSKRFPAVSRINSGSQPLKRGYVLEGIVQDKEAPFAVVNGKVVKKSDKLDGFTITNITENEVEMTDSADNTKLILSF